MKIDNKKGRLINYFFYTVIFNIFIAIAYTMILGFNNMAGTQIIDPIHSEISKIAENRTSNEIQDSIDNNRQAYYDVTIPFDLMMFGLIINFYWFLVYNAIITRKENSFIVLSYLTFGSIFMLFLISISVDVQTWIINEIYVPVFEDLSSSTPLMDFFFNNIGLISFMVMLVLILVNQFDRLKELFLNGGRFEE